VPHALDDHRPALDAEDRSPITTAQPEQAGRSSDRPDILSGEALAGVRFGNDLRTGQRRCRSTLRPHAAVALWQSLAALAMLP